MYQNIIHRKDNNVNSKTICDTILSLPIHPFMRDEEIERVANTILILGAMEIKYNSNFTMFCEIHEDRII